jgi:hypothetical protein
MAVQRVTREPAHRKRRRIGSADDDGASLAQVGDHWTVLLGDKILLDPNSVGVGKTPLVDVDLDRHRHSGQQAAVFTRGEAVIEGGGFGQRLIGHFLHHRVDFRIDRLQPLQAGLDHFGGGNIAVFNPGCYFRCAQAPGLGHRLSSFAWRPL